jgi:hypothetical protein
MFGVGNSNRNVGEEELIPTLTYNTNLGSNEDDNATRFATRPGLPESDVLPVTNILTRLCEFDVIIDAFNGVNL